jgi:Fungal specific transcription factor domain/Fungal Zn(2)-Cys(6) binuclear cluster domain
MMGTKRRRLALSCVDCRKRKVKCGRETPACVRCVRGGYGDKCQYVAYDDRSTALPTPTDDSPEHRREGSAAGYESWTEDAETWQRSSAKAGNDINMDRITAQIIPHKRPAAQRSIEDLRERVVELEAYVRAAGSRPVSSEKYLGLGHPAGPGTGSFTDAMQEYERSLLRGRSFKTQYFGPSHAASLLLQFEDLSSFTRDILKRIHYFDKMKYHFKIVRGENAEASDSRQQRNFQALAAMVPAKERADALTQEYMDTFETTYRVLHVPSFYQRYEQFWSNPDNSSTDFVVQLLLVMAAVIAVVPGEVEGFVGRSSISRETATRWIESSETYLRHYSQKHTTLEYYQMHVLLVIAKRMNCYKVKREWTIAGSVLRLAMAAGLHREPTYLSSKISVFDQEMRRRLWFTILELEMQASSDRGMRASIAPDDWDVLPPLNVHDEDFNESTQSMPSTKPLTDFTRTSFLCKAVQHLPLRLDMLSRINNISRTLDLDAVMALDDRIRQILDGLPAWLDKPQTAVPRALARLQLFEFLLPLHQSFALQSMVESRFFSSRCARRDAALTVMRVYVDLPESKRLSLTNLRDDNFRACLASCHDIVASGAEKFDFLQDSGLAIGLIEKTVQLFSQRVKILGQGFHSYWICSSALGLAHSKASPSLPREKFAQEAADRVIKLHDELMSLQQPGYAGSTFGEEVNEKAARLAAGDQMLSNTEQQPLYDFEGIDPFGGSIFDFNMADIWNVAAVPEF